MNIIKDIKDQFLGKSTGFETFDFQINKILNKAIENKIDNNKLKEIESKSPKLNIESSIDVCSDLDASTISSLAKLRLDHNEDINTILLRILASYDEIFSIESGSDVEDPEILIDEVSKENNILTKENLLISKISGGESASSSGPVDFLKDIELKNNTSQKENENQSIEKEEQDIDDGEVVQEEFYSIQFNDNSQVLLVRPDENMAPSLRPLRSGNFFLISEESDLIKNVRNMNIGDKGIYKTGGVEREFTLIEADDI